MAYTDKGSVIAHIRQSHPDDPRLLICKAAFGEKTARAALGGQGSGETNWEGVPRKNRLDWTCECGGMTPTLGWYVAHKKQVHGEPVLFCGMTLRLPSGQTMEQDSESVIDDASETEDMPEIKNSFAPSPQAAISAETQHAFSGAAGLSVQTETRTVVGSNSVWDGQVDHAQVSGQHGSFGWYSAGAAEVCRSF